MCMPCGTLGIRGTCSTHEQLKVTVGIEDTTVHV